MCNLIALKFGTNKEHYYKGEFRYRVWYEFDKYPTNVKLL